MVDVGDVSSWAGVGIALATAGIAFWQARVARSDAREAADKADAPVFHVRDEQWVWGAGQERFLTVTLVMEQGPTLSSLVIRGSGDDFRWFASGTDTDESEGQERRFTSVAQGKRIEIVAQMEHEAMSPLELRLTLTSVEDGGHHRTWTKQRIVTAEAGPEPGRIIH